MFFPTTYLNSFSLIHLHFVQVLRITIATIFYSTYIIIIFFDDQDDPTQNFLQFKSTDLI